LTVFVPNYNHGHLLPRCLDSILSQSRLPDELLICDDGSTDNSLEIITVYAEKWPVIRVIRNEPNKGILLTIRRLVQEATGELVLGCAADDELCQGFIESAMASAETYRDVGLHLAQMTFRHKGKVTGIIQDHETIIEKNVVLSPVEFRNPPDFIVPLLLNGISCATVFVRTYYLEALVLSKDLGPQSDVLERLFVCCKYGVSLLNVPGMIFHETEGSYSNQSNDIHFAIRTTSNYLTLVRMIRQSDLAHYFAEPLSSILSRLWVERSFRNLYFHAIRGHQLPNYAYLESFDKLNLSGSLIAKLLVKFSCYITAMQSLWLKRCVRHAPNKAVYMVKQKTD
jgi:glycosyltransferase involved in cell wall biosynthesis